MAGHLAVGIETNCTAPMNLERMSLRLFRLMGVDSLFVPDHYLSFIPRSVWGPGLTPAYDMVPSPDAYFDPFVMMGMMATRCPRTRIGTGVTEPFRRHPATLAQAFVTIDHLTKGRAILGVGNGERENTEPYGLPFVKRLGRLDEALKVIRLLWESKGEPVNFDGPIWRLRGALFTTPLYNGKPPPIWIAAHAPKMLALTGRYGDGWYPTKKMTAEDYTAGLRTIAAGAAAVNRSLAHFEPGLQIQLALGKDRRSVLAQLMKVPALGALAMALPGPLWTRHGLQHPLGGDFEGFPEFVPETVTREQIESARRQVTPELVTDGIFAGSVDEVVDEIRPFVAAGLRHLVIWNIGPLATGATAGGLLQLWSLVRKLRKLAVSNRSW